MNRGWVFGWLLGLVAAVALTFALRWLLDLHEQDAFLLGVALGFICTTFGSIYGEERWR